MEFFRASTLTPEVQEYLQAYDRFIQEKIGENYPWPIRLRDWELWRVLSYLPQERGPYQILESGAFNTFLGVYLHEIADHVIVSDQWRYIRWSSMLRSLRIYKPHPLKAPYKVWENALTRAAPGVELVEVDLTDIPYPDDTFDFVTCVSIIEHIPDYPTAIQEMLRVLKPDGLALITTDVTPDPVPYENGTKFLTVQELQDALMLAHASDISEEDTPDFAEENWRYNAGIPVINAFMALRKTDPGSLHPPRIVDTSPKRIKTIGGRREMLGS